jgi:threonine aldolase
VSLSPDGEFTPGRYEAGGAAFHSGAHTVAVIPSNRHHLTLSDTKQFIIQGSDVHLYETVNRSYGPAC